MHKRVRLLSESRRFCALTLLSNSCRPANCSGYIIFAVFSTCTKFPFSIGLHAIKSLLLVAKGIKTEKPLFVLLMLKLLSK